MAAGVITTGNLPRLLVAQVKNLFGQDYNDYPAEWKMILDAEQSTHAFEEDVQWEGLGLASVKPQGSGLTFQSQQQGFTPKYVNFTVATGFEVSIEAMDDNLYNLFTKGAKSVARSLNQTKENFGANVYNRGFNSSYTMLGGDGQPLFSTGHVHGPSLSSTFSNKLPIDAALSESAVEAMLTLIATSVDPRGLRVQMKAERLIVSAGPNAFEAQRILKSDLRVGTTNNDTNAIRTMGLIPEFTVNHYLSSPTAWFIKTDLSNGVKMMERQSARFDQDNVFDTKNAAFSGYERYCPGWSNPQGAFGSAGL